MGDQLLVSLLPVQDNFTITMNSKLSLILFGILVAALAAAMTEDEDMELSEEIASARVVRDAGDRRRRKNGGNKRPRKQRGRKGKGKGKKRNNRPNGARRGGGGRRGGRQSTSTSANSTCFENAVFYMKLWKDVVGNFEKQNKRMTKQNSTGQSKSGKKGTFAPIAFKLVDIGGGSYNNSGAMQLQNLTKTLFDCELSVNASCNPANFPQPNTTFITMCENLTSSFKTAVQACLNKTIGGTKTNVSDACGCWVGPQLNQTAQSIKSCKASDSAKAISKQLSKCQKAFSVCRKYEDDAIPAIMACAQDSTKLTSSSSSNSSSGRRVRATATSCAEILTKAAALSTKVSQKPTADISAEAKEISDVPSTVTCTDAEKTSMKTQVTSMESAISSVSKALSSVQTLLSTLTGTTIASSSLVTSASTSTAASSGRRERLVRDLMRNKF